ncbi:deoxyhypusine synthase [Kipferlia bialata]|uniref:Deoxyhypusine synthase n=1 Tax=Kipferlia bialata TaxID=797122 RepID=A0A9K3CQF3_9EUKA|nr:deoxyhypusine synthase [Kipferlia bialata]|eukprot:g2204.t1
MTRATKRERERDSKDDQIVHHQGLIRLDVLVGIVWDVLQREREREREQDWERDRLALLSGAIPTTLAPPRPYTVTEPGERDEVARALEETSDAYESESESEGESERETEGSVGSGEVADLSSLEISTPYPPEFPRSLDSQRGRGRDRRTPRGGRGRGGIRRKGASQPRPSRRCASLTEPATRGEKRQDTGRRGRRGRRFPKPESVPGSPEDPSYLVSSLIGRVIPDSESSRSEALPQAAKGFPKIRCCRSGCLQNTTRFPLKVQTQVVAEVAKLNNMSREKRDLQRTYLIIRYFFDNVTREACCYKAIKTVMQHCANNTIASALKQAKEDYMCQDIDLECELRAPETDASSTLASTSPSDEAVLTVEPSAPEVQSDSPPSASLASSVMSSPRATAGSVCHPHPLPGTPPTPLAAGTAPPSPATDGPAPKPTPASHPLATVFSVVAGSQSSQESLTASQSGMSQSGILSQPGIMSQGSGIGQGVPEQVLDGPSTQSGSSILVDPTVAADATAPVGDIPMEGVSPAAGASVPSLDVPPVTPARATPVSATVQCGSAHSTRKLSPPLEAALGVVTGTGADVVGSTPGSVTVASGEVGGDVPMTEAAVGEAVGPDGVEPTPRVSAYPHGRHSPGRLSAHSIGSPEEIDTIVSTVYRSVKILTETDHGNSPVRRTSPPPSSPPHSASHDDPLRHAGLIPSHLPDPGDPGDRQGKRQPRVRPVSPDHTLPAIPPVTESEEQESETEVESEPRSPVLSGIKPVSTASAAPLSPNSETELEAETEAGDTQMFQASSLAPVDRSLGRTLHQDPLFPHYPKEGETMPASAAPGGTPLPPSQGAEEGGATPSSVTESVTATDPEASPQALPFVSSTPTRGIPHMPATLLGEGVPPRVGHSVSIPGSTAECGSVPEAAPVPAAVAPEEFVPLGSLTAADTPMIEDKAEPHPPSPPAPLSISIPAEGDIDSEAVAAETETVDPAAASREVAFGSVFLKHLVPLPPHRDYSYRIRAPKKKSPHIPGTIDQWLLDAAKGHPIAEEDIRKSNARAEAAIETKREHDRIEKEFGVCPPVPVRSNSMDNENILISRYSYCLILDIVADIRAMNGQAVYSRKNGIVILGGGLVKHHICNANLFSATGANFAVYVNTGMEFDGSDAGASPEEAKSWGKIAVDANAVKVSADATLVFPLIVHATFRQYYKADPQYWDNKTYEDTHIKYVNAMQSADDAQAEMGHTLIN